MLDDHLKIRNVCWVTDGVTPDLSDALTEDTARRLIGRFATAHRDGHRVTLARDPLGLNKLYVGIHPNGHIAVANYLLDLIDADVPFSKTYAVPPGAIVTLDLRQRTTTSNHYHRLPLSGSSSRPTTAVLTEAATTLVAGLSHLASDRGDTPTIVCLSGGGDSSLIAAYAVRHLPNVTAYTYYYSGHDGTYLSHDALAAQQVADHLGIPIRLVRATPAMIDQALPRALAYGQDWRDFNVHAAIVNDLLASAIAADHPTGPRPLVLTGDLMNEFLADYSPIRYRDTTYYALPDLPIGKLRHYLTRGLQTGDREVGVFHAHGLEVVQPYSWVFHHLLQLPDMLPKHRIIGELAGGSLPPEIVNRPKVRAQIGDHGGHDGIVPHLARAGIDQPKFTDLFCRAFRIDRPADLHRAVRAGIHQPPPERW